MKKRNWYSLGPFLGLMAVLLILQTPVLGYTRGRIWDAWTRTVGWWFDVGVLEPLPDIMQQLNTLQLENVRLRAELLDYQDLREKLGMMDFNNWRELAAIVRAQPLDVFQTRYIINKGAYDGVVLGSPAVMYNSVLVGYITQLNEYSAVLELLTSPQTNIPARLLGNEKGVGLIKGRAHTVVELATIPRDASIGIGEEVVTVGDEMTPPGLVIGRVLTVEDEENQPYRKARLQLPYDANNLRAVALLLLP
jgi:rod shape-determining protein MreC